MAGDEAAGDLPIASRPTTRFSSARWITMNPPKPPIPDMYGSETFSVAAAATIASTALPPCIMIVVPARDA